MALGCCNGYWWVLPNHFGIDIMHIDVILEESVEWGGVRWGAHASAGVRSSFRVSTICDYGSNLLDLLHGCSMWV